MIENSLTVTSLSVFVEFESLSTWASVPSKRVLALLLTKTKFTFLYVCCVERKIIKNNEKCLSPPKKTVTFFKEILKIWEKSQKSQKKILKKISKITKIFRILSLCHFFRVVCSVCPSITSVHAKSWQRIKNIPHLYFSKVCPRWKKGTILGLVRHSRTLFHRHTASSISPPPKKKRKKNRNWGAIYRWNVYLPTQYFPFCLNPVGQSSISKIRKYFIIFGQSSISKLKNNIIISERSYILKWKIIELYQDNPQ